MITVIIDDGRVIVLDGKHRLEAMLEVAGIAKAINIGTNREVSLARNDEGEIKIFKPTIH